LAVKQIEKATTTDSGFEIYGVPVSTVKMMGFIEHSEEHATNKIYSINDGTGSIQCVFYTGENSVTYPNYSYVKVFGTIRVIEGVTKIMLYHMVEVQNMDEVTYHILDCIHHFCKLTKTEKNSTVCKFIMHLHHYIFYYYYYFP
jgi:replication factor A2